jgi:hypothetical protein
MIIGSNKMITGHYLDQLVRLEIGQVDQSATSASEQRSCYRVRGKDGKQRWIG